MTDRVLVTGASRGIGAAVLARLGGTGPHYGTCRPGTPSRVVLPGHATWIEVDFERPDAQRDVIQGLQATPGFRALTGVVLNAGIVHPERFDEAPVQVNPLGNPQIWVNLIAPLQLLRSLLAHDCLAENASVVWIGSNLARRGLAGKVSYSAAKAGIEGATRALAHELAPRNIRVNTVAPGLTETDMAAGLGPTFREGYCEQVPAGRLGQPEDVAKVVEFFLGPASAYVNGQVLDVDGGWAV